MTLSLRWRRGVIPLNKPLFTRRRYHDGHTPNEYKVFTYANRESAVCSEYAYATDWIPLSEVLEAIGDGDE